MASKASKRIQGITIEIGAKTGPLISALKNVDKQLDKTQGNLKDIDKLLKFNPGNTELLTQKQRNLQTSIKSTQDRLKELKKAQYEAMTPDQYDDLQREIIETETKLKSLKKEYKDFGSVAKQQIKAVAEKMQEVGKKISGVGDQLTQKITMPIVAGFGAALKVTADFDQQMSKVKAIGGESIDTTAFEKLRQTARDVAASTKFDANEVAQGYEYMAMAGWKAEAMLGGIKPVMNLAAASGEELGMVSDIVTDNMTAFGLTIDSVGGDVDAFNKLTTHFTDVLAAASTNSNTNVSMLGESFKYAAANASAMGYSAEDTAIALGLMANAGVKSGQAGRALRNIFSRIAKPTKESANAINYFNLATVNADGSTKSFRDIMKHLRQEAKKNPEIVGKAAEAARKLSEAYENGEISEDEYNKGLISISHNSNEFLREIGMLAGTQGLPGLLAIVNASDEDFDKLTSAIDNSDGAAQAMADEMNNNLAGQVTILMSKIKELAISFGDIFMPYVRGAVEWVQGLIDKFNGLDEGTKEMIVKIGAVVAAIGPVLAVGGRLISGLGSVITLLTGPAGIAVAIGAVIGFVVNLYKTNEEARDKINAAFTAIAGFWTNTLEPALTAIWSYVTETLAPALVKAWQEDIQPAIETAFTAIAGFWTDTLEPALTAIWSYVTETLAPALIKAWQEDIQPTIESVFNTITSLWNDTLKPTFEAIYTYVVENLIPTLIEWWENHLQPVIENVFKAIAGFWEDTLKPTFDDIQKFIVETLAPKFTELGEAVTGFVNDNLIPFVDALSSFMSGDGAAVVTWLKDTFVAAWEGIKTEMQAVLDFVTGVFKGDWGRAWDALVTMISTPFNTLGEILKAPINAVIDAINWMIGNVEGAINKVIKGINKHLRIDVDFGKMPDFLGGGSLGGIHWGANLEEVSWGRIDKLLANGGILQEGQRAIVGEHAPEYVRVVNGQAIVTPMTSQPARLGGNQTFNFTINTQPGQSAEQIAAAVKRVFIREMQERSAAYA